MPNTPHTMNLYIKNIAQLVTCQGTEAKHGREAMGQIHTIEGPAAVVIRDGIITFAGRMADVAPSMTEGCRELDATGRCVLPGFVDSHTHLVFGGYREDEFQWRLAGDSYMSIMERGGGIASTMRATRAESEDELKASARRHLSNMMKMGVTTVEAKSGYGMNLETELKQLRVVRDLQDEQPLDLYSTFMGAHDTAPEYKGADSKVLLSRTVDLLAQHGYRVGNVDCTVCAERPKINPHIDAMKAVLAPLLRVDLDAVSIKATTSERMGFVGREEGMAAHAVALIERV